MARRGNVELFRSYNETNFVGAERDMREEMNNWNQYCFQQILQQKDVTWLFNPPGASHCGSLGASHYVCS